MSDPLKPWDRLENPVDKFSYDLWALRLIVKDQEERIKKLEQKRVKNAT